MLAEPAEAIHQALELLRLRNAAQITTKPIIIWEPKPSSCIPANLDAFQQAAHIVNVFSPNHVELAAMFQEDLSEVTALTIAEYAMKFVLSGIGQAGEGCVVIRAGDEGCFVASQTREPFWLPPYYDQNDKAQHSRLIDPTGAGNAFLGGFAMGFLKTDNIYDAACYGSVSASLALEQLGLPELSTSEEGRELWNGECVTERLRKYQARLDEKCSE